MCRLAFHRDPRTLTHHQVGLATDSILARHGDGVAYGLEFWWNVIDTNNFSSCSLANISLILECFALKTGISSLDWDICTLRVFLSSYLSCDLSICLTEDIFSLDRLNEASVAYEKW